MLEVLLSAGRRGLVRQNGSDARQGICSYNQRRVKQG